TAETSVMIGDNPSNEISGALKDRWRSIYFDTKGKPFESESKQYLGKIYTLSEVPNILGI
ncbi:MAG: hypothetical protein K2L17_00705, partial [Muribaculaceae bacterium]|nr:hypothetical protein [Muribaculaceae bacterium]